ncbi:copper amine oxidase N-terminal domain-containing protein [Paenibacillus radicis (ex Xue et al. 2023)]|uniref:Copper amine oxidase N-terminal domain-containing protein n=1 Tax=Paenibacillus radicis (ex Xue et al. 2023) TaxID=2972489 RepID=A0ABT1YD27_9BACL|nr:copper amine oxidase N-terminal domain-containing protein [Paenibacillus radicis (ex Xue et al. 2023)]MCR8630314.1 copper amine oxidase N-terminal domain-containing protein [Paenibacillus radicis (ex Xue et al. 2023)]
MNKKMVMILVFITAVISSSFGSAYAAVNLEPINAFFNRGVSFVLKGDLWQPKDESGNPLTAIHYEGSNYLPVRALAEALKIQIDYDAASQKIYIGGKPGEKTPIFAMPMEIDNIYAILSKDPKETLVKNKKFQEVLKIDQYGDVIFTIDRKYKRLVLDAAVISPGEHEVDFALYNASDSAGNAALTVLDKQTVSPEDNVKRLIYNVEGLEKVKIHVQSPNLNPYIYARLLDTSFFDNGDPTAKDSLNETKTK